MTTHDEVAIVGGGQAGLSLSWYLQRQGIEHIVFEKECALHAWRTQRWDSFCLVTPNWQCALPGYGYRGPEPHGFMVKDEIVAWLDGFKRHVEAPLREGVTVLRAKQRGDGRYALTTSAGEFTAGQVVVASGGYHKPIVPRLAERLVPGIVQLHSAQYRNPQALPPGAVLVVGCGQSGAQIAEDLHLAGRRVFLATGDAPRCARFYRGKDVVDWLAEMGYYDMPVHEHPLKEGVRDNTNHYVTGRDGGRDIDLRKFALEGMELYGRLGELHGDTLVFEPNLKANLDHADQIYDGINASIDKYIAARGIDAPPGGAYVPVWEPREERRELNLRAAGIAAVI
jgi:putative flavoprotein involved in K+ transport